MKFIGYFGKKKKLPFFFSNFFQMWKKSGAWFYKEIPEYIKPEDQQTSTPLTAHHAKKVTSEISMSLTNSSNKSQQLQKEQQCK